MTIITKMKKKRRNKMDKYILYSTGCPKCKVLKSKLDDKKIDYIVVDNIDEIMSKGIESVPVLEVNGEMMNFKSAVDYVNKI